MTYKWGQYLLNRYRLFATIFCRQIFGQFPLLGLEIFRIWKKWNHGSWRKVLFRDLAQGFLEKVQLSSFSAVSDGIAAGIIFKQEPDGTRWLKPPDADPLALSLCTSPHKQNLDYDLLIY
jgi:hypothetical protein